MYCNRLKKCLSQNQTRGIAWKTINGAISRIFFFFLKIQDSAEVQKRSFVWRVSNRVCVCVCISMHACVLSKAKKAIELWISYCYCSCCHQLPMLLLLLLATTTTRMHINDSWYSIFKCMRQRWKEKERLNACMICRILFGFCVTSIWIVCVCFFAIGFAHAISFSIKYRSELFPIYFLLLIWASHWFQLCWNFSRRIVGIIGISICSVVDTNFVLARISEPSSQNRNKWQQE